jgi:hypothetical protein
VFLDAIAQSGPNRDGVVKASFDTDGGGILGSYRFEPSGDPSVGPITILKASSSFEPDQEITPKPNIVTAARATAKP